MKLKLSRFNRSVKWLQLHLESQTASISDERIGPILGQHGLNAAKFCLEYNERSFFIESNLPVCVHLYFDTVNSYKTYFFILSPVNINFLLYHGLILTDFGAIQTWDLDLLFFYKLLLSLGIDKSTLLFFYNFVKSKLYGLISCCN